jgi:uncharacterized protein YggU (UPF0235/DUF167 family)
MGQELQIHRTSAALEDVSTMSRSRRNEHGCVPDAGTPWTIAPDGLLIAVRLTPKGGRDAIEGLERLADGSSVVKARVRAAPHEGAANAALLRLLATALDTAPRNVSLAAGATARVKRIKVAGDGARLAAALDLIIAASGRAR